MHLQQVSLPLTVILLTCHKSLMLQFHLRKLNYIPAKRPIKIDIVPHRQRNLPTELRLLDYSFSSKGCNLFSN